MDEAPILPSPHIVVSPPFVPITALELFDAKISQREQEYIAAYQLGQVYGKGTYGVVFAARRRTDGTRLVVKRQQCFGEQLSVQHAKRIYRELVVLRHLCCPRVGRVHPNLVQLLDVCAPFPERLPNNAFLCLVMDDGGRTISRVRDPNPKRDNPSTQFEVLDLATVRDLAWQLLQGVFYMHAAVRGAHSTSFFLFLSITFTPPPFFFPFLARATCTGT